MLVLCYGVYKVFDSPRYFVSADIKARVQRDRLPSRPFASWRAMKKEKQERVFAHWSVVLNSPQFRPAPQAAVRISVSVWGRGPACTASLASYASFDITSYMIIDLLSHVHSFIIVTKSITSLINNFSCLFI